jgi:hypothetical protein
MTAYAHTGTTILTLGVEEDEQGYVAFFEWSETEPPEDYERRWNELAQDMWRRGLEPVQDEPHYSHREGDTICNHYLLREADYA